LSSTAAATAAAAAEQQPTSSLHKVDGVPRKFAPLELESADAADDGGAQSDDAFAPLVHHGSDEGDENGAAVSPSKSHHKRSAEMDDGHGTSPPGSATTPQVIINIVISFVGAGLLGIPNAFSQAGWLLGSITLLTVSALNVYAMLCLPVVQTTLQNRHPNETIQSYGDLGRVILGHRGEKIIFLCLGVSQAGFATAYLIFIAANLNSIYGVSRGVVCSACVPGLAMLVQFRDLKSLSPFSLLANAANFCALSAVLFQDYES
jgi:proton-coupled amino acid transporter